jgi:anti-sigma regulatory factor (Ser/Thr protein kinase)
MRHSVTIYDSDAAMLERASPFLLAGLEEGEAVLVSIGARKRELLAQALGSQADAVVWVEHGDLYARPEGALAAYDAALRRLVRDGAGAVRVFAELPHCDNAAQFNRWIAYEAIVNRALDHHPVWILCGYDAREAPEPLLESALDTHPELLADEWTPSDRYHDPTEVVSSRMSRPEPLAGLRPLPFEGGPRAFREALNAELTAAGVAPGEAENMILAAGEVFANAKRHGGETVTVMVGRAGDGFVCEISDDGPGIDDPLAGFLPPRPNTPSGAGLWVARQLTRQLEVLPAHNGAAASVRLWI